MTATVEGIHKRGVGADAIPDLLQAVRDRYANRWGYTGHIKFASGLDSDGAWASGYADVPPADPQKGHPA